MVLEGFLRRGHLPVVLAAGHSCYVRIHLLYCAPWRDDSKADTPRAALAVQVALCSPEYIESVLVVVCANELLMAQQRLSIVWGQIY